MGPKSSAELKNEAVREKIKIEIEDIYCMFDETIEAVRCSKFLQSERGQSNPQGSQLKSSKISNLDSVLDQLLESFKLKESYSWGKDIFKMFKKHFRRSFEEMWPINKEEFYKLVLSHCNFETIDLKNELQEIAHSMEISETLESEDQSMARRMSYERYFYEVGAAKIQKKLPSSFIGEQHLPWEESFRHADEQETQFNMAAINETIIKQDNEILVVQQGQKEEQGAREADFLPLFVNINSEKKGRISQNPLAEIKKNEILKSARVQNVSVIAPETVFFERLTQENKAEISDLVKFYREFANGLQQMFFSSTSMVSAPYKHFLYCLEEKMKRKNIKNKEAMAAVRSKAKLDQLLYSERAEGRRYREMREFNNNLLLVEIREFAEAFTDFVWMFLELNQIGESKLGKLLNIYTVYGIVVKSIWKYVEWIGDRGCEYEERKVEEFYRYQSMPNNPRIHIERKKALLTILRTLAGEKNPQKYLKKIVIFYREANKLCNCADDLIGVFEELLIWVIKEGLAREMAIFRMPVIIDTVLKLEETLSSAGEISYSWTTWCIVIEILKGRIGCGHMPPPPAMKRIETEPDYEEVVLEE